MTYLVFHLIFTLPPILGLAFVLPRPLARVGGTRARHGIPLLALVAFVYTTPWDNFLVYRNVWSYGRDRVLATIMYVPIEEYAFFILQPVLTGLFLYYLLARIGGLGNAPGKTPAHPTVRFAGTGFFLALSLIGVVLLASGWESGLYTGLILAWAGPIVTLLWLFGGNVAWEHKTLFITAVATPTAYLWCADAIALRAGVWDITETTSLGLGLFGLPVEEAAFFLLTNLMVVLGLLLWLFGERAAGHALFERVVGASAT